MIQIFKVADENQAITSTLVGLLAKYKIGGRQIHDANIVATMLVNGIDILLTTNIEDFKRYEDRIKVISPLKP